MKTTSPVIQNALMPNGRNYLRQLIHACIITSCASTSLATAQQGAGEPEVEEVVVTGSYIRNSAFAQNSPVDTVTQEDLQVSGAPNMSQFIRDMTYTQATDVVKNVLAPGGQVGAGASFNLRGLGSNSTLMLIDGQRSLLSNMNRNLPEIAISRLEVVLDGGSATYGSDAVAGVVNVILEKNFEGFKARTYYQRTEDGAMEDFTNAAIWGKSFSNGINYTGALEFRKKTDLMMYERPREMDFSATTAPSGNPGSFKRVAGATPGINLYGHHGGVLTGPVLTDPSCETFNAGFPDHGQGAGAMPSGHQLSSGQCAYEWSLHNPYAPAQDDYSLYNTISIEANDWLRLSATLLNNYHARNGRGLPVSSNGGNDRDVSLIRADHPANPYGFDVVPWSWHVVAQAYTHKPSNLSGSGDYYRNNRESLNRAIVSAEYDFDFTESWTGYTTYSQQASMSMSDLSYISLPKLQLALAGQGGPNGDEYFNPFGSADPRSPFFEVGVTDNSQELTDWLWIHNSGFVSSEDEMEVLESVVSGELYDLPAGTAQMAAGYQYRDLWVRRFADPNRTARPGIQYNGSSYLSPVPEDETYRSEVHAAFLELQVPILETLDLQLAVRHENFKTFGLDATTPKVSLRWEALPTLAIRGSWGESFLAPTPIDARPFVPDQSCAETYTGRDEISGTNLAGGIHCSSGNPSLEPETSVIQNVGFTWQPEGSLDGLTISLDYQEIEYKDRIQSLSYVDTIDHQFNLMLAATGISRANYDPTPGSATRNAANAWLAALPPAGPGSNKIDRFPTGEVKKVYRQAANISSVWIDLFDANLSYEYETSDWGTFSAALQASYYTDYRYEGLSGGVVDALGRQNDSTDIVPPLPELKANLRLSWYQGNQSASISTNYWHDIDFDAKVFDYYADIRPGGAIGTPRKIKGEHLVNARYGIFIDEYFDSEFNVSVGVNNLFDKMPQRLGVLGGFESR
ncbi:MAG: TonB-dependent receptor, partial [Pseudohongiellaceae bacterium]